MKTCKRCQLCKPVDAFCRDARLSDGLQQWCKSCKAEYRREWMKSHPEKRSVYNERWQATDPSKALALKRRWVNAYRKRARVRDPDKAKAADKARSTRNREKLSGQYLRQLLRQKYGVKNPSQEAVDALRAIIQLKRLVKDMK